MHHVIKWHALKYHHYVTSILENHFVNWPEWHYIEMGWNAFGDQIKVIFKSINSNDNLIFKTEKKNLKLWMVIFFVWFFQYFHCKSYAVERLSDERLYMQSINCHYRHQWNHISNHTHSHHPNALTLWAAARRRMDDAKRPPYQVAQETVATSREEMQLQHFPFLA